MHATTAAAAAAALEVEAWEAGRDGASLARQSTGPAGRSPPWSRRWTSPVPDGAPRAVPGGTKAPPERRGAAGHRLGLRAHLFALALAVLLPALAVGTAAAWRAVDSYRAGFQARLQDTARALALALDARIGTDLAVLTALAAAPALDTDADPAAREALLGRAAASIGTDIALLDPADGRYLVHTGSPPDSPAPMDEAMTRAVATGRPVVADLAPSATTGRFVIGPLVPVTREGRVAAVLAARLEPATLLELLRAQNLPEDGFAVLKDGQGRVVARSVNHEASLGRLTPPWFREAIAGRPRGVIEGRSLDGTPTLGAFERLRVAPGWSVSVVVPRAGYVSSWVQPLGTLAIGAAPLLVLSAALALCLGRRLLRPVEALRRHARAVAEGGAGREDGTAVGIAEFDALRADIVAAEAALRAGEARWRGLFEGMHEGFALCELVHDAEGRAVDFLHLEVNPAFERLMGVPAELAHRLTACDIWFDFDPSWVETFARAVETGEPTQWCGAGPGPAKRWFEGHAYPAEGRDRFAILFFDVTERKEAEERQALLAREVDHRAKNALAVVMAAIRLTRARDVPSYVRALEGRVGALARAQTLLAEDRWSGADLHALLWGELVPFVGEAGTGAELDGPPVALPPGAAQPLAMAMHELATNAVKHGALTARAGRVSISWRLGRSPAGEDVLLLRWAETGGPALGGSPERRGFGSRVLDGTVRGQLGGAVSLDWQPDGLVCRMEVPLRRARRGADNAASAAAAA